MKNKNLIIIVLVLAVASAIFLMKDKFSTYRPELKDFAVTDTANISKIFLANRSGKQVLLERKSPGRWMLNSTDRAKNVQIRVLLETISKVQVRTPVSKQAYNNVLKRLASNSIKCEIYLKGEEKPTKVYYVGGSTEDIMGTFMMIEGSSTPFITEIPGFNGYLTPRYSVEASDYKETAFLQATPQEIKSLSVSYRNFPENSFILTRTDGKFQISAFVNGQKGETVPTDSIKLNNFASLFNSLYVERWISQLSDSLKTVITVDPPAITISLTTANDSSQTVYIYPMPLNEGSLTQEDENGKKLKYDLDKVYGNMQPGDLWAVIQHFNLDRILRRLVDFDERKNKNLKSAPPVL